MEVIILILHLLVCICLIGLVLLQRSEGGALGMGGGGASSLMSGRGAADALAKMTSVAGGFFLLTSISLTVISGAGATPGSDSVFDRLLQQPPPATAPATQPATPADPQPTAPDPTESSLTPETQLASAATAPPEAAPATTTAATRAAPLTSAPATQRPAAPASQASRPPPQRTAPATTPAATEQRLQIPNTSGAVSGVNLTDDDPSATESIEIGPGVEAVRRERAGPDQ